MWLVHCIAQKACGHTRKTPNCLLWRWYIVSMPPPFLSAKTQIWGLDTKNVQCLLDSPMPPKFLAGGRSPFLWAFRQWKSIQNCKPPSFFLTNTMVLHKALWLGQMEPDSSISLSWLWTSSTKGGGIHLNCSLKGVSSVTFIVSSVVWVQPNSVGSNEKTSWYSAKSQQVASANSKGHNFNPLKSNFLNSLPCLCLVVKLGGWGSWG